MRRPLSSVAGVRVSLTVTSAHATAAPRRVPVLVVAHGREAR